MRILIIKILSRRVELKRRHERCSITIQETVGVVQKGKVHCIEYLIVLAILLVLVAAIVRN